MKSILFLCCLFSAQPIFAQKDTEKELVQEIINTIQTADDSAYASLFPPFEMMTQAVYNYQPKDSFQTVRINKMRRNLKELRQFDARLNPKIIDMMNFVRAKAADSGVHWGDILIVKHELDKQRLPYKMIGFELVAPIRMQGFIFIRDMLTRRRYGIAVRDIYLINDKWYGGRVLNILEASSSVEYEESLRDEEKELQRLIAYKQQGLLDSVLAAKDSLRKLVTGGFDDDEEDEDIETMFKDIAERKFYTGYFDKQVEVELYVRGIKGSCPDVVCSWEAMYKFGDIDEYIVVDVEKREDGTFVFTEEDMGVMEVKLQATTFTGTWTALSDKTEYEVYLKENVAIKDRKLFKIDRKFEEMLWE